MSQKEVKLQTNIDAAISCRDEVNHLTVQLKKTKKELNTSNSTSIQHHGYAQTPWGLCLAIL